MNISDRSHLDSENIDVAGIERQIEDYEFLVAERNRFTLLERNAEKYRESVRSHIFEKVKSEYTEKRIVLDRDHRKQEESLMARLETFVEKRRILTESCEQDADVLEEMGFRVRVGEFAEEAFADERREVEQRQLQQTERLTLVEGIVKRFARAGLFMDGSSLGTRTEPAVDVYGEERDLGEDEDDSFAEAAIPEPGDGFYASAPEGQEAGFLLVEDGLSVSGDETPVVHCSIPVSTGSSASGLENGEMPFGEGSGIGSEEYIAGYLIALDGSRQGERFPLIRSDITLGNSSGIDIRLDDSGIANSHARILYKEHKHYLENLDASGRSFVNGVEIDMVELKDGDVLRFGEVRMQVEYALAATSYSH